MDQQKTNWESHIKTFEGSGQKATDYCKTAGLNLGTFRHRLYKYRAQQRQPSAFQEIYVNTELSLSVDDDGQVVIGGIEPDVLPAIVRAWSSVISQ